MSELDPAQINKLLLETERLAGIGTLTASVAHELTNPISIITTTCDNLLSQLEENNLSREEIRRYVRIIDYSAWRCARLIATLRNYTRSNGLELAPCKLNQIIEDALTMVTYQLERQYDIKVATELEPGLRTAHWDQNQITQVLINLLTNARDALGEKGGRITIKSWPLPAEKAQAFSVSDNGSGIAPEIHGRIFEPFFTTKPPGKGTGLGLAIVASIVEQHAGRITAFNNGEGGATFTVVLPANPPITS